MEAILSLAAAYAAAAAGCQIGEEMLEDRTAGEAGDAGEAGETIQAWADADDCTILLADVAAAEASLAAVANTAAVDGAGASAATSRVTTSAAVVAIVTVAALF